MSPSWPVEVIAVAVSTDPEVANLAVRTLQLVVQAELLYEQLQGHNQSLQEILARLGRYTEQEPGRD